MSTAGRMWRRLFLTSVWCASVFTYNVESDRSRPDATDGLIYKSDLLFQDDDDVLRRKYNADTNSSDEEEVIFQPWSILWYVGSFGGLIAFFLVVSCSEWCCRKRGRRNSSASGCVTPTPSEAPPPAYDLFAPPSYDSLCHGGEKRDYDVFVVPVHAIGEVLPSTHNSPPAYREDPVPRLDTPGVVLNIAQGEEDHRERCKTESATQT